MDADGDTINRIEYTTEPLRLALTRDQFQFMGRMPGCERMEESPKDRWLTKELAPHLHFLAVIRSGCGTETGGGGGFTYTIEVKPSFFVVASIGAWLTPEIHGVRDRNTDYVGRLELIWARKDGGSINLGLFASSTTIGVGFGFTW
jgi:hypothetical protein